MSRQTPRVGVVVSQLGYGGAERQTCLLLEALVESPWRPEGVICLSDGLDPYGPRLRERGYEVQVLPRRGSFDLGRVRALRRAIRERGWTVVHAVHLLASGYAHLAVGREPRIAVLPSMRGTVVRPGFIKSRIYRSMFRRAPRILANSESGARFIAEQFGASAERIAVVPNGVDFRELRARADDTTVQLRQELALDESARVVGLVAKDSRVKNVGRFLTVAQDLLARHADVHAVLIGHGLGPDSPRAKQSAHDRIHFLGPRNDVPALLKQMGALLLTSNSEGCPNVVLEAVGVGTPVVSADVGDVATMAPGACSVVPPDGIGAYVSQAEHWLALGAEGRARVKAAWPALEQRFGLEAMVKSTVDLWQELAARTAGSRDGQ